MVGSDKNSFIALIKDIPKAEIHLHLEGLASVDSIWKLIQKNKLDLEGITTIEDLQNRFKVTSLDDFIELFINIIQSSFVNEEDLIYLIEDAQAYLSRNNIAHAEIFFSPSKFLQSGFSFPFMADILEAGSKKIFEESGISVSFLIDVSRTFGPENAEKNLELLLENRRSSIIGIGLGGSEASGPAEEYTEVFKKAADNKLKVVAHAGEDVGPVSIWNSIKLLKAERIGHGISAVQDEKLMEYLTDTQIPLEICPTSNIFTRKYVTKIEEHPVRIFYDRGINITINSDDPTLFNSDLVDEYILLYNSGVFNEDQILDLIKKTIFASFAPEKRKKEIWNKAEKMISKYKS